MPEALFQAYDEFYGNCLYETDGTAAGTHRVRHYGDVTDGAILDIEALSGGEVVYTTASSDTFYLYDTAGHASGTLKLEPNASIRFDGLLYVYDDPKHAIEVTDGTTAGTHKALTLTYDYQTETYESAASFSIVGHTVLCTTVTGSPKGITGNVYRVAEGGSKLLFHFDTDANTLESTITKLGADYLFVNHTAQHGSEAWVSDGTTGGTHLLKDIFPGFHSSFSGAGLTVGTGGNGPQVFFDAGSVAVFAADDGRHGMELWGTDGTGSGTHLIKDIDRGIAGSGITFTDEHSVGNKVLFDVAHWDAALETNVWNFWATDGTTQGTKQLDPTAGGQLLDNDDLRSYAVGNHLYFSGHTEDGSRQGLYDYNLLTGKTRLVQAGVSIAEDFEKFGSGFLFSEGNQYGGDLWISDATSAGTHLVKHINPDGSSPHVGLITTLAAPSH